MSNKILNRIWSNPDAKGTSRLILLALADQANNQGVCWPAIGSLAEMANVHEDTVKNHLAKLERDGQITTYGATRANGSTSSNFYIIQIGMTSEEYETAVNAVKERLGDVTPRKPTRRINTRKFPELKEEEGGGETLHPGETDHPPRGCNGSPPGGETDHPLYDPLFDPIEKDPIIKDLEPVGSAAAPAPESPPSGKKKPKEKQPSLSETTHQEMMRRYQEDCIKCPITNGGLQGRGAKSLTKAGYSADDMVAAYHYYKQDPFWKGKQVNLVYIASNIGAWVKDGRPDKWTNYRETFTEQQTREFLESNTAGLTEADLRAIAGYGT